MKKIKIQEYADDNLHIEFCQWINQDFSRPICITLRLTESISFQGKNVNFVWEGNYKSDPIRVVSPRIYNEEDVVIIGNFPNEVDKHRGPTYVQLHNEIKRVLGQ